MSTVRMSANLQYDIAREAKNTYDKANPEREFSSDIGNKLYDKYLKEKFEIIQTFLLSKENVSVLQRRCVQPKPIKHLNIELKYSDIEEQTDYDGNATMEIVEKKMHFQFDVSNREIIGLLSRDPGNDYNDYVNVEFTLDITGVSTNDEDPSRDNIDLSCPLIAELVSTREYNDKIYDGGREYKQKVQETIASFTTLNQALKAWPALKDFVSQSKIDKVYEKVERKAKQQQQREAIEVQEQELNSVILTASLLGD